MEIKDKLELPYTAKQRADFIVVNNHNKGYEIKEVSDGLEAWGMTAEEQEQADLENKQKSVRAVRNSYLETYVDPFQIVIRWGTLTEQEQSYFIEYRQYLLDYPEQEGWWENEPETYEEWLVAHHPVIDVESEAEV